MDRSASIAAVPAPEPAPPPPRLTPAVMAAAEALAAAPLEPDGWNVALKALAEATGSARGQLIGFDDARSVAMSRVTDLDDSAGVTAEIGGDDPDQSWRLAASGGMMEVIHEGHYAEARTRVRADAYDEGCAILDIPHGIQTGLLMADGLFYGLAVLRSGKDGVSSPEERARFGYLAVFAQSAVRMERALDESARRLLVDTLERTHGAVFLLDRRGRVIDLSPSAEALLRGPFIRLVGDRLRLEDAVADARLRAAFAHCRGPTPMLSQRLWQPPRPGVESGMMIEVMPLPDRERRFGPTPEILLIARAPRGFGPADRELLMTSLMLTPAEADVALAIASGLDRETIARTRRGSVQTVRSQLRSIFEKAHVSREAELAALVNRMLRR